MFHVVVSKYGMRKSEPKGHMVASADGRPERLSYFKFNRQTRGGKGRREDGRGKEWFGLEIPSFLFLNEKYFR